MESSTEPYTEEPSSFTAATLPNEFYVTVELYLSKLAMQARKVRARCSLVLGRMTDRMPR